jgi:hypothetical protein
MAEETARRSGRPIGRARGEGEMSVGISDRHYGVGPATAERIGDGLARARAVGSWRRRVARRSSRRLGLERLEGRWFLAGDCTNLVPTSQVEGSINTPAEVDCYTLALEEAGRLTALAGSTSGALDARLALIDVGRERDLLDADDVSSADKTAKIEIHLPKGTYEIKVSASPAATGASATGGYRLVTNWRAAAAPFSEIEIPGGGNGVTAGDFDDDGVLDIATANQFANNVTVLLGVGDGTFAPFDPEKSVFQTAGDGPGFLTTGDFDNDGNLDLAVGNETSQSVAFLKGNGEGGFIEPKEAVPITGDIQRVVAGHVDGDFAMDVVVPTTDGLVWVLFGSENTPQSVEVSQAPLTYSIGLQRKWCDLSLPGEPAAGARDAALQQVDDDRAADFLVATNKTNDTAYIWNLQGGIDKACVERRVLVGGSADANNGAEGLVLDDFNEDDRWDIAVVNDRRTSLDGKSSTISLRLQQLDGSFGNRDGELDRGGDGQNEYAIGIDSENIVAADFNQDGILDLAAANEDTRDVSILLGNGRDGIGDGTFGEQIAVSLDATPSTLVAAHVDKDEFVDLVVGTKDERVVVLFGLGNGTFARQGRSSVGVDPDAIVQADFNYDGVTDLAVANAGSHDVSVLLGRLEGGAHPQSRYGLELETDGNGCESESRKSGLAPHALLARDVNGDGRLDLITANEQSDNVSVLLGLGNGTFQLDGNVEVGDSPWSLLVEDLDGDGWMDFATANRKSASVTVLYGDASGCRQSHHYSIGSAAWPEQILLSDSIDGRPRQLATINRLSQNVSLLEIGNDRRPINVTLNDQLPDFIPGAGVEQVWDAPAATMDSTSRFWPRTLVTGDFNRDGRQDVVVADDRLNELATFLGRGNGSFQRSIRQPILLDPEYIATTDLNGDEILDLVTAHDTQGRVSILLGVGDGTFRDGKDADVGNGPEGVAFADFDGNSVPDMAVGNDQDGTLSILLGSEAGDFDSKAPSTEICGEDPCKLTASAAIVTGQFVGDKSSPQDVATMDRTNHQVLIYAGHGDGTFSAAKKVLLKRPEAEEAVGVVKYLATGDLDEDGRVEIIAADLPSNRIWVRWGDDKVSDIELNGGGGVSGSGDNDIRPVIVADFNNDGHQDLATVEAYGDKVVVLFGDGKRQTWEVFVENDSNRERFDIGEGSSPGALASADFDGDGVVDLAVGNRDAHQVSIWLSNPQVNTFTPFGTISAEQDPTAVTLNLNGDANVDRVTLDDANNALTFEIGGNDGFLSADAFSALLHSNPLLADLDGDGITDVVSVGGNGEMLARLGRSKDSATYHPPQRLFGEARVRDITAVETKSGWMLAATNREGNSISIYRRDGASGDWKAQTFNAGEGPSIIAAADLTPDDLDDVVVINALSQDTTVLVQRNSGQFEAVCGTDGLPDCVSIGEAVADVVLADLVGDGDVDLAVAKPAAGMITVWEGDGRGGFGKALNFQSGSGLYGVTSDGDVRSLQQTSSLAVGDFNGDARADLVSANTLQNSFGVFTGKKGNTSGDGSISGPDTFKREVSPDFVVTADFDGDGFDDLAAVYRATSEIGVSLNNRSGGFDDEQRFKAGNAITGLAIGNPNGDSYLDLLVNNQFGDLLILLGNKDKNGKVTFDTYRRADPNVHVAAADLDGDGKQDFIFANESLDTLRVSSQQGGAQPVEQGDSELLAPGDVLVRDLDGDGKLDLIVPNSGGNGVFVYLGEGGGAFAKPVSFHTGGNPSHVSIDDVSGDGLLDLVVANEGSNDVTVLWGKVDTSSGEPKWTLENGPRLNLKLGDSQGTAPVHTFIKDVTGGSGAPDGTLDVVVTNQRSSDVYLLSGLGGGYFDDAHPVRFSLGGNLTGSGTPIESGEPIESYVDNNGDLITVATKSITRFARFNPNLSTTTLTGNSPLISSVGADFNRDGLFDVVVAEFGGIISQYTIGVEGVARLVTRAAVAGLAFFANLAIVHSGGQSVVVGVGAQSESVVPVLSFSVVPRLVFAAPLVLLPKFDVDFVKISGFELSLIPIPRLTTPSGVIASDFSRGETRSDGLELGIPGGDVPVEAGSLFPGSRELGPESFEPQSPTGPQASGEDSPEESAEAAHDQVFQNWLLQGRRGTKERGRGERRNGNRSARPTRMIEAEDLMIPHLRGRAVRRQASDQAIEESGGDAASAPVTPAEARDAHRERRDETQEADGRRAGKEAEAARLVAVATLVFAAPRVCKRPNFKNGRIEDQE